MLVCCKLFDSIVVPHSPKLDQPEKLPIVKHSSLFFFITIKEKWRYVKFPNEVNPNVIFPNVKIPNVIIPNLRAKGTKLGEGERKVRLSQDRMPILGWGGKGLIGGKGLS